MNFGTTSVAAPNAASSSTAKYSLTTWPAASGGSLFSPSIPFCLFASALIRLASTAKFFSADQSLTNAAPQDRLKQPSQEIAIAEAAMPVLREGRMVGHIAIEP